MVVFDVTILSKKKKKKEIDKNGPKMDSSEKKCIKNQIYNNKTK